MTVRDDLESILSADIALSGDDYRLFFRDHGFALLEALADAERYRWLRERPKSYAGRENGFHIHLAVAKPKPNDWSLISAYGESLDQAIDRARGRV